MTKRKFTLDSIEVTVHGTEVETGRDVAIHPDYQAFQTFWEGWTVAGRPEPLIFDGETITWKA